MEATIRAFIRHYNERNGGTILLTSHYMDDVAALCPRVIVIDRGRLSHDGGLDELVRRSSGDMTQPPFPVNDRRERSANFTAALEAATCPNDLVHGHPCVAERLKRQPEPTAW
jgi:ABC-type uncharacterized transport system ATPase subunit